MRRLYNLENSFYKKRFKEIYKILFQADLDEIIDRSNWYKPNPDYIDKKRPLWIIIESKILNKRIWVYNDFGQLGVNTATLDLPVNSSAYSDSYTYAHFKNQKELVNYLEKLLEPCLEEKIEDENIIDEEMSL